MIEVSHLTKRYGSRTAIEDLTFTVDSGVVYGFLGPNGAGKSTTMNILTGCLAATEGRASIDGCDIFDQPVKAKSRVGYLPEQPPLYMGMTVREYLAFVARAKGVKIPALEKELERVIAVTGTEEVAERLIRNLSKGFRQRVGIAQALLADPPVVILDEPTVGLDPLQIVQIRELIRSLGRDHTVILSTHILSEVQAVCDRVLMIHRGRLVASGTLRELEEQFAGRVAYHITVKGGLLEAREALEQVPGVERVEGREDGAGRCRMELSVTGPGEDMDERLSFALSDRRIPVLRLEREQASLEDVFLALTKEADEQEDAKSGKGGKRS